MRSLALRERGFWSCSSGRGEYRFAPQWFDRSEWYAKAIGDTLSRYVAVAEVVFDWSILKEVVSDDYKPPFRSQ